MTYSYAKKIGGTDNGIHLACPKCSSENVVIVVLKDGCYGVEECKKCKYKNNEIYEHLSGKPY